MTLKVLGVGSSMRQDSFSTETLKVVLNKVNKNGGDTRLLNLYSDPLPMYTAEYNEKQSGIGHAFELVEWADAIILATPDYHGSMAGSLKNFLDYFWAEFAGKLFGYICSSHEKGLTVMDQMRTAVRQCYGWSMPYGISINGEKDFGPSGNVTNKALLQRMQMLARDIIIYGKLHRNQFLHDLRSHEINTFAFH